jgi:hypothetical protein
MAKAFRRTCNGRLRHETAEAARDAAKLLEERLPASKRTTYPCCYCHGWHVARVGNVKELGVVNRG